MVQPSALQPPDDRTRSRLHSDLLPPGPRTSPAWQLLRYSQKPLPFLEECARRHGDAFTIRLAGYGTLVMLAAPDAVRDVFRGDGHVLHSGEANAFLNVTVGNSSVLVLDEAPHARQRRVLLPPLSGERMRSFFDAMQAATRETLAAWPSGATAPVLPAMRRITLRTIVQVVLGLSPGPELLEFERLMEAFLATGRSRYALISLQVLPLGLMSKVPWMPFFRQLRELDTAIFALLARRRRERAGSNAAGVGAGGGAGPAEDVVSGLLAATHEDGAPLGDREIRDAIFTLLLAGHETTSLALAWTLERIASHPAVTERIVAELEHVTGGAPPRAEQLAPLAFLDAAIREGLRARTILPFVVRLAKQPFSAGGRQYPAGVQLCPCNHLVHRRPDLYPEPDAFRPERFLERKFSGDEWFPFGGGNRTCLGMPFALYEMKVVLATLFAQVRVARPPGARSRPVRRGITLSPHDGALLTVTARR